MKISIMSISCPTFWIRKIDPLSSLSLVLSKVQNFIRAVSKYLKSCLPLFLFNLKFIFRVISIRGYIQHYHPFGFSWTLFTNARCYHCMVTQTLSWVLLLEYCKPFLRVQLLRAVRVIYLHFKPCMMGSVLCAYDAWKFTFNFVQLKLHRTIFELI